MKNYFERGSGTEKDPYIIHTKEHLYNLAWLQDLGYFSEDTYYFAFCKEDNENCITEGEGKGIPNNVLDMSGEILPPIGTKNAVFTGVISGNDVKVKNLTVSTGATIEPSTGVDKNNIGVFGALAGTASVHNLYFENVTLQIPSSAMSEASENVNAGYLVGHIADDYKNKEGATNASPLYNVYEYRLRLNNGDFSKYYGTSHIFTGGSGTFFEEKEISGAASAAIASLDEDDQIEPNPIDDEIDPFET